MTGVMRRRVGKAVFIGVVGGVAFVLLSGAWVALAYLSVKIAMGDLHQEIDRTAGAVMEAGFNNRFPSWPARWREREVVGIGLYDVDGFPSNGVVKGTAPASIEPPPKITGRPALVLNAATKTAVLIRERRGVLEEGETDERAVATEARYIFLEVTAREYFRVRLIYTIAGAAGPAVFAVLMILLGVLYRRTLRYRRQIDEQKQLVWMGEAARALTHEIRNPLSAIRLQTGLLRKTSHDPDNPQLRVIDGEVERLRTLASRVRDFLKSPTGEPHRVELSSFIRDLGERFGEEVSIAEGPTDIDVAIDGDRLRSVVENLITNALEAGGSPVRVQVSATRATATIRVRDSGPGLAPQDLMKAFDPFFTTKAQGSGLGLAIARQFVMAAGGRLYLVSRSGGGIEAVVSLRRHAR